MQPLTGFTLPIKAIPGSSMEIESALTDFSHHLLKENGLEEMADGLLGACSNSFGIHELLDTILTFMGISVEIQTNISLKETYDFAVKVTDQRLADATFEALVDFRAPEHPNDTRETVEKLIRNDLAYYAGYYDQETRKRVEEMYGCEHPYFGKAAEKEISPEEAFRIGMELGEKHRKQANGD